MTSKKFIQAACGPEIPGVNKMLYGISGVAATIRSNGSLDYYFTSIYYELQPYSLVPRLSLHDADCEGEPGAYHVKHHGIERT